MYKLILIIFTLECAFRMQTATGPKSGPYRSTILRVGACKKPTYRAEPNPSVLLGMEVYNTSSKYFLLRGDLNVTRDTKNVQIRVKAYTWENGKWKLLYLISNLACHGMLLPMSMAFFGIQFDSTKCVFPKGNYHFEGLSMNELQHMVSSRYEYGKMLYRTEMSSKSMQSIFCWEFEGQVVPDLPSKTQ